MTTGLVVGDGRVHLDTELMAESLVRPGLISASEAEHEVAMLPECRVVMIGGRSIFDRGKEAVYPLVEEIVAARRDPIRELRVP